MYFWPYAFMQPVAGLLADVIEPRYIISTFSCITAIGTLIIGFSHNYILSCFARCLVGIGTGPIYVPIVRIMADLYSPSWFNLLNGITMSCGSLGGILAAGPLATIVKHIKWEYTFYATAAIGFIISILALLFLVAPQTFEKKETFKGKVIQLWANFKVVSLNPSFWKLVSWSFTSAPTFFILTSFWAANYLTSVFSYTQEHAGYIIMMLSIATIVGSPVLAFLSETLHTRKYIVIFGALLTLSINITFFFIKEKIHEVFVWILLFLYGLSTSAVVPVAVTMFKEMTTKESTATAAGLANFYATVTCVIFQAIINATVRAVDPPGTKVHTIKAYRLGLWLPNIIVCILSLIGPSLVQDTYGKESNDEEVNNHWLTAGSETSNYT
ncbi:Major Facilitator Superfamily protein [Trichomonas vaginalis G3]|uniref:Lysosomal dipeptide transporter MFSD1 n=1 Tax=Trichomonas vaginalis (strain ATCC PRA-98 / G3) TaxID=412133 RepID=A2EDP3_TRIV3|nr:major facilitator superfamily transporter [Trichomonas vaginalis G3]EAY09208.1 Major Facilitator Superfamily protein [Trichomonas vaginalis G3]KAI5486789.1 Major Facilitator Superfamily [Trichomonas vaginalis G3]|eukprot:XP_001321431.1 major facilitator superfamily transporter [Trichomonas vaginalis G3]